MKRVSTPGTDARTSLCARFSALHATTTSRGGAADASGASGPPPPPPPTPTRARVSSEIASAMDLSHGARSASVRLSPLDIFALLSAA